MYGVVIGGWTIGVYVLQMLWENLSSVMTTYKSYVMWYLVVTGVASFMGKYAGNLWEKSLFSTETFDKQMKVREVASKCLR